MTSYICRVQLRCIRRSILALGNFRLIKNFRCAFGHHTDAHAVSNDAFIFKYPSFIQFGSGDTDNLSEFIENWSARVAWIDFSSHLKFTGLLPKAKGVANDATGYCGME